MTVKIPGSTSNLGPGFDTLGLALNRFLFISAEPAEQLTITVEGNGKEHIFTDGRNLVHKAFCTTAVHLGKTVSPLSLHLRNDIPAYGGLGGSGAAIAGGVFLANEFFSGGLSPEEMLNIAVRIEGHPDNVSAALYGGLTVNCFDAVRTVHCRSVKIRKPLSVVICSPHFHVHTSEARKILPDSVPLNDAVVNIENAASLVAALMEGDFEALRYATVDMLHERYRSALIPGYAEVKQSALDAGALSFSISGAGPTVFAFAVEKSASIADAMLRAFRQNGRHATAEVLSVENSGATLL